MANFVSGIVARLLRAKPYSGPNFGAKAPIYEANFMGADPAAVLPFVQAIFKNPNAPLDAPTVAHENVHLGQGWRIPYDQLVAMLRGKPSFGVPTETEAYAAENKARDQEWNAIRQGMKYKRNL